LFLAHQRVEVPVEIAHVVLPLIVAVSILLMLMRPRGIPEVWWISGGALLLIVLRLMPLQLAEQAIAKGADVYLFLAGMMLLSELARDQGVFDWVASLAVRGARAVARACLCWCTAWGRWSRSFCRTMRPRFADAGNSGGRAEGKGGAFTVSVRVCTDRQRRKLCFADFQPCEPRGIPCRDAAARNVARGFAVPSLLSIVVTFAVMRFLFREELRGNIDCTGEDHALSGNGRLVVAGIALMAVVLLTASAMKKDLGLPTCVAALIITAIVSIKARRNPVRLAREVSWGTLLLVAGLFVMVDAMESQGALQRTQQWLAWASSLGQYAGAWVVGFCVGIANNLVNNLSLGLMAGATLQAAHTRGLMDNAVLIGVDLGPNLSVTGSLATILWLLAVRKDVGAEKLDVSFWNFLKVGAIAMPLALFAALGGAMLMQMVKH
jgi:arsenical pump membrane protein